MFLIGLISIRLLKLFMCWIGQQARWRYFTKPVIWTQGVSYQLLHEDNSEVLSIWL